MSSTHDKQPQFHYKNVLGSTPGTITRPVKPEEGFRIPLIYFSWGLLEGGRDSHHHPDNDELLLILEGRATVGLQGPPTPDGDPQEYEFEVSKGDVILFPQGWVHFVKEKDPVKVLAIFNNQDFQTINHVPPYLGGN